MRRQRLFLPAVLLLALGSTLALVDPFAGDRASGGTVDNRAPTALATVQRRSLTARQTVTGTLGYAGAWTASVPVGTTAADLRQAEQQEASARGAYAGARASSSSDSQALAIAEAELEAARLKEASDCAGNAAAASTESPCANAMQAAATDQVAATAARATVASDQAELSAARTALASAVRTLAAARASAPADGSSASFTMLPAVGDVIRRGQPLYSINGSNTLLLYGATPSWRGFVSGMSPGPDVAELNANLRALGLAAPFGDGFTSVTEQGIEALEGGHATGSLPLGSVAFEPGASRVTSVTPTVGQSVQPGPIMTLSSTRHDVSIQLDAAQESQVKRGDRVLVTLPDNSTTPGVVVSVAKVASTPSSGQGNTGNAAPGSPTIAVEVRLVRPADAGTLDQAPVNVLITTASVDNALVVPVSALVALAGGGYALEEVAGSTRRLIPVTPGLFDDQEGLVQVHGSGLAAGQRVVVPAA